jgi:parallel beta-helix repeat protein
MTRRASASAIILLLSAIAGLALLSSPAPTRTARAPASPRKIIHIAPGPDFAFRVQAALIESPAGTIVQLPKGRFKFDDEITIAKPFITLRGEGKSETILDFNHQITGSQGIFGTADGLTIESLAVVNTAGDGIKVTGGDGITFRDVRVDWERGPSSENGGYGLYPVNMRNVLIEDCDIAGASDSGIYVGQSKGIVVRRNRAHGNVAGIEIENSQDAEVYENLSDGNTGGILVFDLPNLNLRKGGHTRVFHNEIRSNNLRNFAPKGNIVGSVPKGVGVLVLATDQVEVFENRMRDNRFANVVVANYQVTDIPIRDPNYDPTPQGIFVHDNTLDEWRLPHIDFRNQIVLVANWLFGLKVRDVLYDGIRDGTFNGKKFEGDDRICFVRNHTSKGKDSRVGNMHLDSGRKVGPFPGGPASKDSAEFDCEITRLTESRIAQPEFDPSRTYEEPVADPAACASAVSGKVNRAALGADCPTLQGYGLFQDAANPLEKPSGNGVGYDLNNPLFTDYAKKSRFVWLPEGKAAKWDETQSFSFPVGTVIAKTFWFNRKDGPSSWLGAARPIETRLLIHRETGWVALPYRWDADGVARLARGGDRAEIPYAWIGQTAPRGKSTFTYLIPNGNKCVGCHEIGGKARPLGPKAKQLNRDFDYEGVGVRNQIDHWIATGRLEGSLASSEQPRFARIDDASAPLEAKARAYLDANCAHCHTPKGHAGMSGLWLEFERSLSDSHAGICKPPVAAGTAAAKMKFDVVPGQPEKSILIHRLFSNEPAVKMPELGRNLVHEEGAALVAEWVRALSGTCDQPKK